MSAPFEAPVQATFLVNVQTRRINQVQLFPTSKKIRIILIFKMCEKVEMVSLFHVLKAI